MEIKFAEERVRLMDFYSKHLAYGQNGSLNIYKQIQRDRGYRMPSSGHTNSIQSECNRINSGL